MANDFSEDIDEDKYGANIDPDSPYFREPEIVTPNNPNPNNKKSGIYDNWNFYNDRSRELSFKCSPILLQREKQIRNRIESANCDEIRNFWRSEWIYNYELMKVNQNDPSSFLVNEETFVSHGYYVQVKLPNTAEEFEKYITWKRESETKWEYLWSAIKNNDKARLKIALMKLGNSFWQEEIVDVNGKNHFFVAYTPKAKDYLFHHYQNPNPKKLWFRYSDRSIHLKPDLQFLFAKKNDKGIVYHFYQDKNANEIKCIRAKGKSQYLPSDYDLLVNKVISSDGKNYFAIYNIQNLKVKPRPKYEVFDNEKWQEYTRNIRIKTVEIDAKCDKVSLLCQNNQHINCARQYDKAAHCSCKCKHFIPNDSIPRRINGQYNPEYDRIKMQKLRQRKKEEKEKGIKTIG